MNKIQSLVQECASPLDYKEKIQYMTAIGMLLSGVGMSVAGFVSPPLGEISDSVLNYLSQCLIWAGSIFSIKIYVNSQLEQVKKQLKRLKDEK
ncbi:MAG: hypothetical protein J5588_08265 [Bacteroidales bacterium]|nr:hypothetical protein [Bacteroidales bacterium]